MFLPNRGSRFLVMLAVAAAILLSQESATAREWTDGSGNYSIEADLIGFDDENVVLQRADKELGSVKIADLSEEDQKYLETKEAQAARDKNMNGPQAWTTKSGLKLVGRVVDFARTDVTVQRRRGRMYVNDRRFNNLPEIYRELLPKVIDHFEDDDVPNRSAMNAWLRRQGAKPRTFRVDGVILEVANGDEYTIPFFVFSDDDRKLLKAGWDSWLAVQKDYEERENQAYLLEAMAAMRQQNDKLQRQVAELRLQQQRAQAVPVPVSGRRWEVTLYPNLGNPQPPRWVVVHGSTSEDATRAALLQNPGFSAGSVRRIRR